MAFSNDAVFEPYGSTSQVDFSYSQVESSTDSSIPTQQPRAWNFPEHYLLISKDPVTLARAKAIIEPEPEQDKEVLPLYRYANLVLGIR